MFACRRTHVLANRELIPPQTPPQPCAVTNLTAPKLPPLSLSLAFPSWAAFDRGLSARTVLLPTWQLCVGPQLLQGRLATLYFNRISAVYNDPCQSGNAERPPEFMGGQIPQGVGESRLLDLPVGPRVVAHLRLPPHLRLVPVDVALVLAGQIIVSCSILQTRVCCAVLKQALSVEAERSSTVLNIVIPTLLFKKKRPRYS